MVCMTTLGGKPKMIPEATTFGKRVNGTVPADYLGSIPLLPLSQYNKPLPVCFTPN